MTPYPRRPWDPPCWLSLPSGPMRCPARCKVSVYFVHLVNSVHKPVVPAHGKNWDNRLHPACRASWSPNRRSAKAGGRPGLHVDKKQRSNYILRRARLVKPRSSPTTGTTHIVGTYVWHNRNPCVPNFGAAATPINHGAAYDRQTFSYPLHCPPPSLVCCAQ